MGKFECTGWIGKLFGHRFKSFLIELIAPSPEQIKESFSPARGRILMPSYTEEILRQLHSEKYIVRCKRCGAEGGKKDGLSLF